MAKAKTEVTTPFDEPPVPDAETVKPKKKRYSPMMDAIHKIDRILEKLSAQEREQVYLHYRNQFQPGLSFVNAPSA